MTYFTEIYDLNEVIKLDSRLFGKPDNFIYQLYYKYLSYAISYFRLDCYKDLDNHIPFSQVEYEFTADGITNEFVLNPTPPENSSFYVSANDVSIDFQFDESNNKIITNSIPDIDSNIYISAYIIGQFNDDLNTTEKIILSEGMNLPYLEQQRNKNELLNQMVYGNDFKIYSQSAHIKELKDIVSNQQSYVKQLINEYTFKQNPNGLLGLGGGLT